MLNQYIAGLNALIDLEEEAHDPDRNLPGLYVALQMAQEAAQRPTGGPAGIEVLVSTGLTNPPLLSGRFDRGMLAEGAVATIATLIDMWQKGEPKALIIIKRIEEEN